MDSPYTFLGKSAQNHKCIMLQAILYPSQRWSRVEIEMAVLTSHLIPSPVLQLSVISDDKQSRSLVIFRLNFIVIVIMIYYYFFHFFIIIIFL